MVGLKAFWILLSTLMFVACVPKTKQTECASNEAFNASLRTCVPIVQGASSFINIKSFVPQFTQTRSKNDTSMLTFSITVDNPYNQSYSVEWERVFNAAPTYICSNSLTCSFAASYLGTVLGEIGTHIITAKVKDGKGAVVASHSFELKVNELPRPVIVQPVTPADLTFSVFPTDPRVEFSFNIKNNGAYITAAQNYRTEWTVLKNGTVVYTESDAFTNITSSGTNRAYLGNPGSFPPTPAFNPATFGIGSYSIRAAVRNDDPGEIVAEQYWNLDVKQPSLSPITNISKPAPGVTVTAHNDVNYTEYPVLSWIDPTKTQPEFCVTVDKRGGTYAADGKSILVKFYLNSVGGDICTVKTQDSAGSQQVCLIGAQCQTGGAPVAFNPAILKFNNPSPSVDQVQSVTARLYDEATGLEFDRSNVVPSNGSYPIEWKVLVKPKNTAPKMSFGPAAQNPTGCAPTGTFTRSNCQVNQGQSFLVSFTVTDDFYDPASDLNKFQWNVDLKLNGASVPGAETSCYKAFADVLTTPNDSGPYHTAIAPGSTGVGRLGKAANQWACQLQVPHNTPLGPLSPMAGEFTVVATMEDKDSPVGGAGLISQSLTWKLVVTETNDISPSGIEIDPQDSGSFVSKDALGADPLFPASAASWVREKDKVYFNIRVADKEGDNLKYKISLCTNNSPSACTGTQTVSSPSYVDFIRNLQLDPDDTHPVLKYEYTVDEYLLQKITPVLNEDKNVSNLVYFQVEVMDVPSILVTPVATKKENFRFHVRNYNPAPVVKPNSGANPAVGSTIPVLSGYPVTIYPGLVEDDSSPGVEKDIKYQWYASSSPSAVGTWNAIDGATFQTLRYTPGNITTNIELKLCVGDRPNANPIHPDTGSCSGIWTISPRKSIDDLAAPTNGAPVDMQVSGNEIAVWYDDVNPSLTPDSHTYYTAYEGTNLVGEKMLYVDKVVKKTDGTIHSKSTISFSPLDDGTPAGKISDLSITGTFDALYIAYLASFDTAPEGMMPRVRRIDISRAHGKELFGFNYNHYPISTLCAGGALQCAVASGNGQGSQAQISFNTTLNHGETITINGYTFTASNTSVVDDDKICAQGLCPNINSTATSLAQKINQSKDYRLQGISAQAAGGSVSLFGQYHNDYIDFNGTIANPLIAKSLGKIFVSGTHWHLPMVNTLSAQNKVTVVSGPAFSHLRQGDPFTDINTSNTLTEMGEVSSFDAGINTMGELVFARVSGEAGSASRVGIFRYSWAGTYWTPTSGTGNKNLAILGAIDFDTVKFAPDASGNNFYYVMAREKDVNGGKWHIGRYHPDLTSTYFEGELGNRLLTSKDTEVFGDPDDKNTTLMKNPVLVSIPGFTEARIFFSSVGSGTNSYPRLAQWKTDDTISCGTCASLTQEVQLSGSKIGVSAVSSSLTFGSPGSVATENTRDVFFTGFHLMVGTDPLPFSGIINSRAEAIQSTITNPSGLWRPPFVLDQ